MGVSASAEQDSWISILLASAMTIPVVLVYARILHLFPEKDICEITEILFGKIGSKLFILLFTWYAIHLGGLIMCNFHEFIALMDLPNTPHFVVILPFVLVILYLARSGLKILGNWSIIILIIILFVVIITVILSFRMMKFTNLLPIFNHDIGTLSRSAFSIFSFPLAETVLFLPIFGCLKKGTSPYKIYISGILLGSLILLIIILRNIVSLGSQMVSTEYFPSYVAARIIDVESFLTRMEGTITVNFILAGITKTTVCVFAASKCLSKLIGVQDSKPLIIPVCLLMLAICFTSYQNIMQMFTFAEAFYPFYALIFQVLIPFVIWIVAEIRTRLLNEIKATLT